MPEGLYPWVLRQDPAKVTAVVFVGVGQTDEVEKFAASQRLDGRAHCVERRVRIDDPNSSPRECDEDRLTDAGLVEVKPEHPGASYG